MVANFDHYIERFRFTPEGREVFLNSVKHIANDTSNSSVQLPFNPVFFWLDEDLKRMDPAAQTKLLEWLFEEALTASKTATDSYDYSIAPETLEELEEEVQMIRLAGAIYRVLQLRDRNHLSIVLSDAQGLPYRRYPDGRIEYLR